MRSLGNSGLSFGCQALGNLVSSQNWVLGDELRRLFLKDGQAGTATEATWCQCHYL